MRVISYLSLFSSCLAATRALVISTPQFLTAGPARINFTKEEGDPVGAFFNIAVASNASRLVDDVDLSAGFVDVDILVLPGTYSIFAFGNDTGGGRGLGSTDDFPVIALPNSPPVSTTGSSSPSTSPTSASQSPSSSAAGPSSTTALDSAASSKKTVPTGMIIGIVVAILVILVILIFLLVFLRRRKQRRTRRLPDTGDTIETPGPMVQSSLSLTARSHVDPFLTPESSNTSLSSPAQRQQYITNEMRLVRKQMEELRRTPNISTSGSGSAWSSSLSSVPSAVSPSQASTHGSSAVVDLERSRQQNDELQGRIAQLEAQLQSAWALGLSNEPPPGYVA